MWGDFFQPGENENRAMIWVTLTPYADRERTADQIIDAVKEESDALDGFTAIKYFMEAGGPPVGRPISLRVVGSDDRMRAALADSVMEFLATLDGVTDIIRDDKRGKEQLSVRLNYPRLAELGLTVADVARNLRLAYDGEIVTRVRYGDEDVGFRVILDDRFRGSEGFINLLTIPNRQGRMIPLRQVASFGTGPGPANFIHYDGDRSITVSADLVPGSALTPLTATGATADHFDLSRDWPGMRFHVGGEAQETAGSVISLGITLLIAAIGIYLVLVLLFNSVTQPLLVMIAIPFGMIGVIGAFALHREPLGFLAMLGVVGMMGVVVNDSLILINYINRHRLAEPDKSFKRLVAEGTAARLRPIILTSVTTVSGLIPLAYGWGGSDPFLAPMALALGYGILFATPLTLLLLPCLYAAQHDLQLLIRRIPGLSHFDFLAESKGFED
jgi:multidrug efflux pump subunit AcrB